MSSPVATEFFEVLQQLRATRSQRFPSWRRHETTCAWRRFRRIAARDQEPKPSTATSRDWSPRIRAAWRPRCRASAASRGRKRFRAADSAGEAGRHPRPFPQDSCEEGLVRPESSEWRFGREGALDAGEFGSRNAGCRGRELPLPRGHFFRAFLGELCDDVFIQHQSVPRMPPAGHEDFVTGEQAGPAGKWRGIREHRKLAPRHETYLPHEFVHLRRTRHAGP